MWNRSLIYASVAVLLLALPATAQVSVEARGGLSVPVGDLARIAEAGPTLGLGLAYVVGPSLRLRTDVDFVENPGVKDPPGGRSADVFQWFIMLGLEYELVGGDGPWGLRGTLGAGVSLLSTDPLFGMAGEASKLNEERFAATTFVEGEYRVSTSLAPYFRAQLLVTFLGDRLAAFQHVDPSVGDSGPLIGIPLEVGVRYSF